jgi:hypothetical protein
MLANIRPELAEEVRGTAMDPFHDDTRIPSFFTWLITVWGA